MPHRKQVRRAGLKSHPLVRDAHAPTARGAGVADVKDAPPCERAPVRAPLPRQRGRVRGRERRGAPESCGRETRRSWKRSEIGAMTPCEERRGVCLDKGPGKRTEKDDERTEERVEERG